MDKNKAELIARLMHGRDEWELLINHVGAKRVGIGRISGHWSVKNIVAHISVREQYLADRLAEIARGEQFYPCDTLALLDTFMAEFGYPDFESPMISEEAANEWVYQKYKNVEMRELIADELHAFDAILAEGRAMPPEKLDQQGLINKIQATTLDHYHHHAADIKKHFIHSVLRNP
ncbi:MAG: hypothetical protein MUO77_14995 [Anaerolineales bacterium]|nr:hypothetical protein [Anaerolineales bacterium]